jgi:hydroxymethylglutaryl-CoA lyase
MPTMPACRLTIREVGLRDGLQSIARVLPLAHKLEWLNVAHEAGLPAIEVGSFVPASWLEGEALHGTVWRAGLPRSLQAA